MKIMAFGKNLAGDLLFNPTDEQLFFNGLVNALEGNAPSVRRLAKTTAEGVTFRGEIQRRVMDAGDPCQAGWTFLVAHGDPLNDQVVEIMRPLAEHRRMDNPAAPLVFDGGREEGWGDWLQEHYFGRELIGQAVPRYVLIIGGPDHVPFQFQSLMDAVANVGRLHFDSLDGLKQYVDKVIRLETAPDPVVKREVVLFGTDGGLQDPTYFSRKYMAEPLAQHIRDELHFTATTLLEMDATKKKLARALRGTTPALVYTASHGLGLVGAPLAQQMRYNGAICCQTASQLSLEDLFSADDVPLDEPFLEGAVFFQFACFGYGTPAVSDYTHWLKGVPEKYAETDFVAALPQRLLAHPRGLIAYIGHLDTAFMHGFTDQNEPHILERWHARVQPFVHAVEKLLEVQPSGLAMEDMNKKCSVCNALLTTTYDRQQRGTLQWTPETQARFVDTWIIRSDAQNYMVFGDPAARLRVPEA